MNKDGRTTREVKERSIFYETGDPLFVNNVYGSPALGIGTTATVALHQSRRGGTTGLTGGVGDSGIEIGVARLYDFKAQSASYENATTRYEARLFDVKIYTRIRVSSRLDVVSGDVWEGQKSGAFGFIRTTATNQIDVQLVDTNGTFIEDEIELYSAGDLWWFDNKQMHHVENKSKLPRVAIIFDVLGSYFREKI